MLKTSLLDILESLKRADLWLFMGWQDVKRRYRRSALGPLWIVLSTMFFVGAMTVVYSGLFRQDINTFLTLTASGIVTWTFIANCLAEGCNIFISASNTIKQVPAPLPVHVFKLVWNQLIYFLHNMIVVILALTIAGVHPQPVNLLFFPALALLMVNLSWMALLLGSISARFRDVPLIVQSLITAFFLVTPIIWQIRLLPPNRQWIAYINPFTYLVESMRLPLLGIAPSFALWSAVVLLAVGGWTLALFVYSWARPRIAYWV